MPYADKEKQREYQRNWIRKRREDWLKENGPCKKCGSWSNLDIHHKDPKQKVSHRIWSWSKKRREIELAKCEVLCEPCHGTTWRKEIVHGTYDGYNHHGCRCKLCKEARREYRRRTGM